MNDRACPREWIDLAERLAEIARPIAKRYFRTAVDIFYKADASPVTVADCAIETALREEIERVFPKHGILGEEHGGTRLDAEAVWVLDPIDGTKAFIAGMPTFGTLIACCAGDRPVLGVIDQPIQEERWLGAAGRPSLYNGTAIRVRGTEALERSVLYVPAPDPFERSDDADGFRRLKDAVGLIRYGADCYAHGLLASGHVDLVVESGLRPYDYCALVPVIDGAGGVILDWDGNPLTLRSDGRTISAATPALFGAARTALVG